MCGIAGWIGHRDSNPALAQAPVRAVGHRGRARTRPRIVMLKYLYRQYFKSDLVRWVHRRLIGSPFVTRIIFGCNSYQPLSSIAFEGYFDLTTVCLYRTLRKIMFRNRNARLCEIGVGPFAILSRAIAPYSHHQIDAGDLNPHWVELARKHHQDGANIRLVESDILSGFAGEVYDIIFWNLPYTKDPETFLPGLFDPETFLPRLFEQVPPQLSDQGRLIIGYNPATLARKKVLTILNRYPELSLECVENFWWNLHDVLLIAPRSTGT